MKGQEAEEQKDLVRWLELNGYDFFAIVNEYNMAYRDRKKSIISAIVDRQMGKKRGVSDLVIFLGDKILFLEMKRPRRKLKNGQLSKEDLQNQDQKEFEKIVSKYEYAIYRIAYGYEDAVNIINELTRKGEKNEKRS